MMIRDVRGRFWAEYSDVLRLYDRDIAQHCWERSVVGQMTDTGVDPVTGEIYHTGRPHPAGWQTPVSMEILEQIMDEGDPMQAARDADNEGRNHHD